MGDLYHKRFACATMATGLYKHEGAEVMFELISKRACVCLQLSPSMPTKTGTE